VSSSSCQVTISSKDVVKEGLQTTCCQPGSPFITWALRASVHQLQLHACQTLATPGVPDNSSTASCTTAVDHVLCSWSTLHSTACNAVIVFRDNSCHSTNTWMSCASTAANRFHKRLLALFVTDNHASRTVAHSLQCPAYHSNPRAGGPYLLCDLLCVSMCTILFTPPV
jgi:hypothetical protein